MSSFGGSIKLTGEDEYRRALKNITTGLREVSSQISLTTSSFENSDKKTKDLKQAQEQLSKIYDTQKSKVEQLRTAYTSFSQKVQEQATQHNKLVAEYNKEKSTLEGLEKTVGTTSKEYQDQKAKVEELGTQVAKSTKNYDDNQNALSRMGTELNKAEADLNKTEQEMQNLGKTTKETGDGFTVFKGILANLGTQAINSAINGIKSLGGALISIGKDAITSYADFEQLQGGVETLFGAGGKSVEEYAKSVGKSVDEVQGEYDKLMTAQQNVMNDANEAYKTAGLSANEYMETVTSFSASLISSLGGDTVKASEYSKRAITDMSDNANKMGTDISMIQNAYQGFAKQNYTMLDNLKLGYGGTKTEMERLIKDASKLTDVQKELGVTVDANDMSFGNIVNAISVMQSEMGIMGTTSLEASTTISGSVSSMQSAWSNLLTGIADDNADFSQLIDNFVNSLLTVAENLLPRIKTVVEGLGKLMFSLVEDVLPQLLQQIPSLLEGFLPTLMSSINTLMEAVLSAMEQLLPYIQELIPQLVTLLIDMLPQVIEVGIQLILTLIQGIAEALPQLVSMLPTIIMTIMDTLLNNLPLIIQTGVEVLVALIEGLAEAIPQLIDYVPTIIETIINVLMDNLPLIITSAIQIMVALIKGLTQSLPKLISFVPRIITTIVSTLAGQLAKIIKAGADIVVSLINGLVSKLGSLGQKAGELGKAVIDGIKNGVSTIANIGRDIVEGLWNGISNATSWIKEKVGGFAKSILNGMKSALGIHSPSKVFADEVGTNIALGIGEGFTSEMGNILKEMENAIPTSFDTNIGIKGNSSSSYESEISYNRIVSAFEEALSNMKIELDDEEAGRFVRRTVENAIYT